ncbi:hypothetical protein AB0O57_29210 [Streptomyces sp. NPDC091201]|uniref:hypothetical protein n=1 Tax=Streptomyces sp. NPDC091201 TaxID=3155190 RepID=UPI003416A5DB
MSDESIPKPRPNRRPDVEFTPVSNGLDYLLSAVEHLEGAAPPDARSLKYGVLHLQAATEVLLKARLVKEHWSLVFANPGQATQQAYANGDFNSCTIDQALQRLQGIVSLDVPEDGRTAIGKLQRIRNGLTHFAHVENAHAVDAQAAKVLSFLLDFIHAHLKAEPGVAETMGHLRAHLHRIQRLVDERMKGLAAALAPLTRRTVQCPQCDQWALVVGTPTIRCQFCLCEYGEPESACIDYLSMRTGSREPDAFVRFDNDVQIIDRECGMKTLVKASVAESRQEPCLICFNCGELWERQDRVVYDGERNPLR